MIKNIAAIIVLVVGVYSLLEGTYPAYGTLVGGALIAFGAALLLGYFWLIGNSIERWLGAKEFTFMPVLLVLGLIMVGFGIFPKPGMGTDEVRLSFAIPGLALVLYTGFRLLKAIKE